MNDHLWFLWFHTKFTLDFSNKSEKGCTWKYVMTSYMTFYMIKEKRTTQFQSEYISFSIVSVFQYKNMLQFCSPKLEWMTFNYLSDWYLWLIEQTPISGTCIWHPPNWYQKSGRRQKLELISSISWAAIKRWFSFFSSVKRIRPNIDTRHNHPSWEFRRI